MDIKNKKICLHTLGCKVNRAESDAILGLLTEKGAVVTEKFEPCDIYIFNTCAVTNEAERKSRNLVSKALRLNKNAMIYVLGCSSQNNPDRFKNDNVIAIYGTDNKTDVVDAILTDKRGVFVDKVGNTFEELPIPKTMRTRAYVVIQQGCNNFCTYCLIPYVRGRSRSRKFECIEQEIKELSKKTKEIVLTGVNTADYGKDLQENKSVLDICNIFNEIGTDTRFRFSSLEFIKIIDDNFLQAMKNNSHFCDQFHLSLQNGSDSVLKSMNRHYLAKDFINGVKLIRKYFPTAGITTDVIVGFPTETDEEFEKALETYRACEFTDMHIFPYSVRSGTTASKLYKELNGTIIKKREERLFNLKEEMKTNFLNSLVGKTMEVLVENSFNGVAEGYARNFVRCYFSGKQCLHNNFVNVIAIKPYKDGLWCENLCK